MQNQIVALPQPIATAYAIFLLCRESSARAVTLQVSEGWENSYPLVKMQAPSWEVVADVKKKLEISSIEWSEPTWNHGNCQWFEVAGITPDGARVELYAIKGVPPAHAQVAAAQEENPFE